MAVHLSSTCLDIIGAGTERSEIISIKQLVTYVKLYTIYLHKQIMFLMV